MRIVGSNAPTERESVRSAADEEWVVRPHRGTIAGYLAEVWRYRRLIPSLTVHAAKNVYQAAILGMGWLFIRPFVMAVIATFVVQGLLGVSTAPVPFLLFVLASLSIWLMFLRGMKWGTKSMQTSGRLMRQFYFPRFIAHATSIAPAVVEFGVVFAAASAAAIYFAATGVYAVDLGLHSFAALLAIAMALLLVIGITCVTSVLNNIARDVWYTMRYVLMGWSLLTPVFYPRSALPEPWREYMLLNPMTPVVELYRWSLVGHQTMRWDALALSAAVILVLLVLGLVFFIRWEPRSIDAK